MPVIILHHYAGSLFAEKVRVLLGAKRLAWRSLLIAVTPPKPSLTPVLGAFRRMPVPQVGGDFFCDTRAIARIGRDWRVAVSVVAARGEIRVHFPRHGDELTNEGPL